MIVDTSGFNAILRAEPDARHFAEALAEAPVACITAATFLETAIVAEGAKALPAPGSSTGLRNRPPSHWCR
ncbi:type II toxin-antitoxin system VapC family toxin [Siccirubricoccus deserti]